MANHSDRFGYYPDLPEEIREIFMWLCQDVVRLQASWNFYYDLFTSTEYQELHGILVSAFLVIEQAVRNDITMSIARISDPKQTKGKDNLTFAKLAHAGKNVDTCTNVDRLEEMVLRFESTCEPIRIIRNKKTGHNDLNTRIDPLNNPLPGFSPKEINEILRQAKEILNRVIGQYVNNELNFDVFQLGNVKTLLFYLKIGREYQEQKQRQVVPKPESS